jgi:UDP-perosamine 4-acetyltransferase
MVEREPCVIVGGGGHAAGVVEILRLCSVPVLGFVSLEPTDVLFDLPRLGNDQVLESLYRTSRFVWTIGVGGAPGSSSRKRLFRAIAELGIEPIPVIHPSAVISPSAQLGRGGQCFARVVVHARAVIGENVILNTGAIVEHDTRVGAHAHIAPGAVLCGEVRIGEGAFVGAGAVVIQGVSVGEGATVGAGAVVVGDVDPGEVVVGNPARPLRRIDRGGADG